MVKLSKCAWAALLLIRINVPLLCQCCSDVCAALHDEHELVVLVSVCNIFDGSYRVQFLCTEATIKSYTSCFLCWLCNVRCSLGLKCVCTLYSKAKRIHSMELIERMILLCMQYVLYVSYNQLRLWLLLMVSSRLEQYGIECWLQMFFSSLFNFSLSLNRLHYDYYLFQCAIRMFC